MLERMEGKSIVLRGVVIRFCNNYKRLGGCNNTLAIWHTVCYAQSLATRSSLYQLNSDGTDRDDTSFASNGIRILLAWLL